MSMTNGAKCSILVIKCSLFSGVIHSFILQATVDRLKLKTKLHQRLWLTVVDGKSFECESVVSTELLFRTGMGNGSL